MPLRFPLTPGVRTVTIGLVAAASVGVVLTMRSRARAVPAGPPEVIVERFVEELAGHAYVRALPYLSRHLRDQTIPVSLEVRVNELERRTGALRNVRGFPQWTVGTRAYAIVEVDSERAGEVKFGFGLVHEDHVWRIEELYDLGWKPRGVQEAAGGVGSR